MSAFDLAGHSVEFLALLALALALSGLIAGTIGGLLGVGGGIVLVPVLYQAFEMLGVPETVRMELSVATSLATIIPTSLRSLASHNRRGAVDWTLLKTWAPGIFIGAALGSWVAAFIGGDGLRIVFVAMAFLLALYMALAPDTLKIADSMPKGIVAQAMASVIGGLSVLMGIGGGAFAVSLQTLYGAPIHRAVATASGFGFIIAIPGALGFVVSGWGAEGLPPLSLGYVSLAGFLLITPATVLAAPWGARLAHALPRKSLRLAFAGFLAASAARILYGLLI